MTWCVAFAQVVAETHSMVFACNKCCLDITLHNSSLTHPPRCSRQSSGSYWRCPRPTWRPGRRSESPTEWSSPCCGLSRCILCTSLATSMLMLILIFRLPKTNKKPLVAAQSNFCPPLYYPTPTHRRPARRWGRSRCGRTRRRSPGCWAGCRRSRRCRSTPAGGNTAPRDRTSWGTGEQVKHNSYLFNEKNIYLIGKPKYYLCEKHR